MSGREDRQRESGGIRAFKEALKTTALLLKITMVLLFLAFIFSNIKYLEQYEKGVVLRFGALQGEVREEAGMYFSMPYPIDQVLVVKAGRTQSVTSKSFMYQESATKEISPFMKLGVDGYLLTADGDIFHCESTLKYRIEGLKEYLFSVNDKELDDVLTGLIDNAVLKVAARLSLSEVLDKKSLISDSRLILQKQLDDLGMGIKVELLDLKILVPRQVEADRQEVTNAMQDAARLVSEAELYSKKSLDIAESSASRIKSEAEVWRTRMMAQAEADLKTLEDLAESYKRDPKRVKEMLLRDAVVEITPYLEEVFVFDANKNRELRIVMPRKGVEKKVEGAEFGKE